MESLGVRILERITELAVEQNKVKEAQAILNNIFPNLSSVDLGELDLRSICKLEVLFGEKLLIVPTKQQWRKIKLEKLNEICENQNI